MALIQQLCADTGCSVEGLIDKINDRDWWKESVKGFHIISMI